MSRKDDRNAKMLRALGQEERLEGQAYLNTFVLENYIRRLAVTQFSWESECDIDFDIVDDLCYMISIGLDEMPILEVNGKRTFGYDVPILYKRA